MPMCGTPTSLTILFTLWHKPTALTVTLNAITYSGWTAFSHPPRRVTCLGGTGIIAQFILDLVRRSHKKQTRAEFHFRFSYLLLTLGSKRWPMSSLVVFDPLFLPACVSICAYNRDTWNWSVFCSVSDCLIEDTNFRYQTLRLSDVANVPPC